MRFFSRPSDRLRKARLGRNRKLFFNRLEDRALLATIFTVTSVDNTGPGTLRQAIINANSTSGYDEIRFAIAGSDTTIDVTSALPPITEGVKIDGYSLPGSAPNSLASGQGLDSAIKVELNGSGTSAAAGLEFSAGSGSLVQGLAINDFLFGITLRGPSTGTVVSGNFIGTNAAGTDAEPNIIGVALVPNAADLSVTTSDNRIEGNLISGNAFEGIIVGAQNTATASILRTTIVGNYIGTNFSGALPLGNGSGGSTSFGVGTNSATDTQIGGDLPGEANVIAFNIGAGVQIGASGSLPSTGNSVRGNSIHDNEGLGIAGNRTFLPTILSATAGASSTRVVGRLSDTPNLTITLDFYANNPTEPEGFEGRRYLGSFDVLNNASGDAFFDTGSSLAGTTPGEYITATTTYPGLDTSKFSSAVPTTVNQQQLADAVTLVNALPSPPEPLVITVNLAAGTTYAGITASPPPGVTLILNGDGGSVTFEGHSPALTVTSGTVIVTGLNFINSTDASTILVTGGTLQMRDSTVHETTGGNRAAVEITGGSVDLGTDEEPGGNTLYTQGPGSLIRNANYSTLSSVGSTYFVNGVEQSDGDIDPAFGDGGTAFRGFPGRLRESLLAAAINPVDGRTYIVAKGDLGAPQPTYFVARYNANGLVDQDFGTFGYAQLNFAVTPQKVVFQPADDTHAMRIVMIGSVTNLGTGQDFFVARYNLDGTADSSFGGSGSVATDIGSVIDIPRNIAFAGSHMIVVGETWPGATINTGGMNSGPTGRDIALAKYREDGALETSFGSSNTGKVVTNGDLANAIAIDENQRIVVAAGGDVWRYLANGALDLSFNGGGNLKSFFASNTFGSGDGTSYIGFQNWKIVVAANGGIMRLNPDNGVDTSFGNQGFVSLTLNPSPGLFVQGMVNNDSEIVVGVSHVFFGHRLRRFDISGQQIGQEVLTGIEGTHLFDHGSDYLVGGHGPVVAAYRWDNGHLDLAYGANGRTFGAPFVTSGPAKADDVGITVLSQEMQSDSKVLLLAKSGGRFVMFRQNPDGSPDTSFGAGPNHWVDLQILAGTVSDMTVADGLIYALGKMPNTNKLAVFRFTMNGALDTSFGTAGIADAGLIHQYSVSITDQVGIRALYSQSTAHLVVTPQGIVVAANNQDTLGVDIVSLKVTRLRLSDQQIDTTFGNNGIVDGAPYDLDPFGRGSQQSYVPFLSELTYANGRLTMLTSIYDSFDGGLSLFPWQKVAALISDFDASGALISQVDQHGRSFNGLGDLIASPANWGLVEFLPQHMATQGNQVIAAGEVITDIDLFTIALRLRRFNADGSLDYSFGDQGTVELDQVTADGASFDFDHITSLTVQADGKIVIVGHAGPDGVGPAMIGRLNSDGSVDESFDGDGFAAASSVTTFSAVRATVDPDGYVLVLNARSRSGAGIDVEVQRLLGSIANTSHAQAARIAGLTDFNLGEVLQQTIGASDPDPAVEALGFEYVIDWGDGSPVTVVDPTAGNGSGLNVDHAYTTLGTFTVQVTAANVNSQLSVATTSVSVGHAIVRGGYLIVAGTSGDDEVTLTEDSGVVTVSVNAVNAGAFVTDSLRDAIYLLTDGSDTINSNWGGQVIGTAAADTVTVNAYGVAGFAVRGLAGNDTMVVHLSDAAGANVRGGDGADDIEIVAAGSSFIDVEGEGGDDNLSILCMDQSGGGGSGGSGDNVHHLTTTGSAHFELNADTGTSQITYQGSENSSAIIGGSRVQTTLAITISDAAHIEFGDGTAPDSVIVIASGSATMTLNSGDGDDSFTIVSTSTEPASIDAGEGSDTYTVLLGGIAGTLSIADSGSSGEDHLIARGTNQADDIEKQAGVVRFDSLDIVFFAGIDHVTIDGAEGDDQILEPGENTTILGGPGNDTIIINATTGTGVALDGGPGSDNYIIGGGVIGDLAGPVAIVDSGTTGVDTVTILGTNDDDSIDQTSGGFVLNDTTISVAGLESGTIDGGGGADEVVATGTPPVPVQVVGVADLIVVGTSGNDHITYDPGAAAGEVVARLNGQIVSRFVGAGKIVAYGGTGDDNIQVAGTISLPVWLYGDAGNDRLNAGGGGSLLIGGDGNDELLGGNGRDVMIGGQGADRLIGNANDDILIAGLTTKDDRSSAAHEAFWCAVLAEWNSANSFTTRVNNLRGDNAAYTGAKLMPEVLDDYFADEIDFLNGSSGNDWLIFSAGEDKVVGQTEAAN